jgi:hypothetical protein
MAALTMPEIDDGPLRDLLLELHRLHARAGGPVAQDRWRRRHVAHDGSWGVCMRPAARPTQIADYLAGRDIRAAGSEHVLDRVDRLWVAADRQSGTAIVQPPGAYRSEPSLSAQ